MVADFLAHVNLNVEAKHSALVRCFLLSVIKAAFLSKHGLCQGGKAHQVAIVVGNGPSLNETLTEFPKGFPGCDVICVNSFPKTDKYEIIKPNACVFADPSFWAEENVLSEFLKDERREIYRAISEKTTWPIDLFFPYSVRDSAAFALGEIRNRNVNIRYYNARILERNVCVGMKRWMWKRGLAVTGLQTVLNTAISLAISLRYRSVAVVGADASFLEDVIFDQEKNMLVTIDRHYYDDDRSKIRRPIFSDTSELTPMKVGEYLHAISLMFSGFEDCSVFADHMRCQVYNCSKYSWVDAFERIPLSHFLETFRVLE